MGFYQEQILPWLVHLSMRQRRLAPYRNRVVSSATQALGLEIRASVLARAEAAICCVAYVALCAGFRTPALTIEPSADATGVRKAPRHEIAWEWSSGGAAGSMGIWLRDRA